MTIHSSGIFWDRAIRRIDPEATEFSKSRPHACLAPFCEDHLENGGTVLDLGCGGGRNSQFLAERGFSVHGLDISPAGVDLSRKRLKKAGLTGSFSVGELSAIPCPDSSFAAVVCIAALDHVTLPGAGKALGEMRRVLRPAGKILLTFDPPGRDEEIKGEATLQEDGSLYFFSGEQEGMLFRRYTDEEIKDLIGRGSIISFEYTDEGERVIVCV